MLYLCPVLPQLATRPSWVHHGEPLAKILTVCYFSIFLAQARRTIRPLKNFLISYLDTLACAACLQMQSPRDS